MLVPPSEQRNHFTHVPESPHLAPVDISNLQLPSADGAVSYSVVIREPSRMMYLMSPPIVAAAILIPLNPYPVLARG